MGTQVVSGSVPIPVSQTLVPPRVTDERGFTRRPRYFRPTHANTPKNSSFVRIHPPIPLPVILPLLSLTLLAPETPVFCGAR